MRSAALAAAIVTLLGAVSHAEQKDAYTLIREKWAASEDFNPLFGEGDGRGKILDLFSEKKFKEFLVESEKYLQEVPVDMVMFSLRATACAVTDDMRGYFQNNAMAWGLAASVCASGTGKTKKSAFRVVSTKEEYGLLHLMGLRAQSQRLIEGKYDVLTVQIGGEDRDIWFDVSKQFEFYGKMFRKGEKDKKKSEDAGSE